MDRNSNSYTIGYAFVVTILVAVALAFVATSLQPLQEKNEKLATQKDILKSVGLTDVEDVESTYNNMVEGIVLNHEAQLIENPPLTADEIDVIDQAKKPKEERLYPLFIFTDESGEKKYIIPLQGNGLWDKIWGYVALEDDFNTIAGVSFDHKAETPGLGAEIKDNPEDFNEPYVGKQIYNDQGEFVSVMMKKGTKTNPEHQIDAISGATITSDGVNEMMYNDVQDYLAYFESLEQSKN